jgi:diguanylate cyclase (GGDEF)-like protein
MMEPAPVGHGPVRRLLRRFFQGLLARLLALEPRPAAILALVTFSCVGIIDWTVDRAFGENFIVTALYLVPITLAAFSARTSLGVALCFLALAVEYLVYVLGADGSRAVRSFMLLRGVLDLPIFVGSALIVSAARRLLDAERAHARVDPLTGVANQRAFREAAELELARARRTGGPFSLLYLDVDDFKRVNDTHGHARGDELLRAVGQAALGAIRVTDVAARLGGDEFAVLLPGATAEQCRVAAERLRRQLSDASRAIALEVTFSVGGATFERPPASVDAMLHGADEAMYRVKRDAKDGLWLVVLPGQDG